MSPEIEAVYDTIEEARIGLAKLKGETREQTAFLQSVHQHLVEAQFELVDASKLTKENQHKRVRS